MYILHAIRKNKWHYAFGIPIIFKSFLGFINISESQNAHSLTSANVCFLQKYNRSIPIIAQSYDKASVMSGKHGGVKKKIQEKYPYALGRA